MFDQLDEGSVLAEQLRLCSIKALTGGGGRRSGRDASHLPGALFTDPRGRGGSKSVQAGIQRAGGGRL